MPRSVHSAYTAAAAPRNQEAFIVKQLEVARPARADATAALEPPRSGALVQAADGALTRPNTIAAQTTPLIVGVFIASGAAGLIYQVVWSSQLVLVFGNTTEAIGTIVTAFLAGLGLGGLVGGLVAPRLRHPLRLYGVAELAVGATALLVPVGFQLIDGVYRSAYDSVSSAQLTIVRLLLTLGAVTPVTFLMGLTLPLLTRHLVTSMRDAGSRMGLLYSANTFGAVLGTLLAGFVLVEAFGLSTTVHIAIALNLLAGVTATAISTSLPARTAAVAPDTPDGAAHRIQRRSIRRLLYAATFISGFVALSLEVLWTRMFAEGTGSTIYIFVVILAVYLSGIAGGGRIYRSLSSPQRDTPVALAAAFAGIAVSTVVSVPVATMLVTTTNVFRALLLLPATLFMGYAFPLTARLLTRTPAHGSRSIGVLYAWNTLGAILGSLAAAFVLAGTIGTNASILILGAADAAVALALIASSPAPRSAGLRLSAVAAVALVTPPLLVVASSPVVLTATQHKIAQSGLPAFHTEDRLSTVDAVGGPPAKRRLYASGTAMTSLSVDTKLMAYVPKIIRPDATSLLDICFGMGTTFRSALQLGLHVDAVDLSPSVPLQMPMFYNDAAQYLHSPNARVITADGRNYVKLTSRRYDLITVDPPPPIQTAGASVLYTQQFYEDAHRALNHGGVMLQWLYFGIDLDQFREHLRTFRSVFSHVTVLISPRHGGVYMLGSDNPITWNNAEVVRYLDSPEAVTDIAGAPDATYLPPGSWTSLMNTMTWISDSQIDRFVGDGPLLTDDHPLTEYYVLHQLFDGAPNVTETQLRALTAGY